MPRRYPYGITDPGCRLSRGDLGSLNMGPAILGTLAPGGLLIFVGRVAACSPLRYVVLNHNKRDHDRFRDTYCGRCCLHSGKDDVVWVSSAQRCRCIRAIVQESRGLRARGRGLSTNFFERRHRRRTLFQKIRDGSGCCGLPGRRAIRRCVDGDPKRRSGSCPQKANHSGADSTKGLIPGSSAGTMGL